MLENDVEWAVGREFVGGVDWGVWWELLFVVQWCRDGWSWAGRGLANWRAAVVKGEKGTEMELAILFESVFR